MESVAGLPGRGAISNRGQPDNNKKGGWPHTCGGKHFSTRKSSHTSKMDSELVVMSHCLQQSIGFLLGTRLGTMDVALLQREPFYATYGPAAGCGTSRIIQAKWCCKQDDEADICCMADDMQAYLLVTKLGTVSMALFTEGATVCNLWVIQASWCFRQDGYKVWQGRVL